MAEETVPSWEDVARRYGRKIYNFAYRLTGNPDDAADLVQEVLLRVRTGLAQYTPGSFEGWLWRITRNAFLDGVRKKKRRPTSPLPDDDRVALGASPSPDEVLASVRLSDDDVRGTDNGDAVPPTTFSRHCSRSRTTSVSASSSATSSDSPTRRSRRPSMSPWARYGAGSIAAASCSEGC